MSLSEILGEAGKFVEQSGENYERAGVLGVGAVIVGFGLLKLYLLKKYVFDRKSDKKESYGEVRRGIHEYIENEQRKAFDKIDTE